MNKITETLLGLVSDWKGAFGGAYNIRVDGACAGRQSSEHIRIESKEGAPGLVIHIAPEAASIPTVRKKPATTVSTGFL